MRFGMGVDQLTMLLTNQTTIREVILYPHLRSAEK
jgi:lysyl-tRNA synthetase, class II